MAVFSLGEEVEEGEGVIAEINITPLTDIFLVLLIIFMVTSSTFLQQGMEVNLPTAGSTSDQAAGLTITVARGDRLFLEQRQVSLGLLPAALRQILRQRKNQALMLIADQEVDLGRVISILDIARREGVRDIAIATRAPAGVPAGPAP